MSPVLDVGFSKTHRCLFLWIPALTVFRKLTKPFQDGRQVGCSGRQQSWVCGIIISAKLLAAVIVLDELMTKV